MQFVQLQLYYNPNFNGDLYWVIKSKKKTFSYRNITLQYIVSIIPVLRFYTDQYVHLIEHFTEPLF